MHRTPPAPFVSPRRLLGVDLGGTAAADRPPELVAGTLGNDAGWIGAALADGARV
ncbi:hypothetical protein [Micrococcus porci]|uniref:hypothetical protein n=1 Tax=Micrococcus porci TaxID=2856555 RepID=UPI003CEC9D45